MAQVSPEADKDCCSQGPGAFGEARSTHRRCPDCVPMPLTDERDVVVWSLEEVARMVEANSFVNRVKEVFPGAAVTNVKPAPGILSGRGDGSGGG